jgi:hypothetical protein
VRIAWCASLGIAAVLTCSCALEPRPALRGIANPAELPNPFAPASLDLHPLTRIDRDAQGHPWIIAYVELRDAWGDPTKGTGTLQVQLYRQVGGSSSALGEQELTWSAQFSDLDFNAKIYDAATRMYRLPLEKAPEWLVAQPEPGAESPRARLRAILDTFGPKGEPRRLEDELTIGG